MIGLSLILSSAGILQAGQFFQAVRLIKRLSPELQERLNLRLLAQFRNDALADTPKQIALCNVQALHLQGANINAVDPRTGESALTAAARYGSLGIMAYCLSHGAEPNFQDITEHFARAPMHTAGVRSNPQFVHLIADWGGKVNVSDKCGDTPLDYAVDNDNPLTALALMDRGARVNSTIVENLKQELLSLERDNSPWAQKKARDTQEALEKAQELLD